MVLHRTLIAAAVLAATAPAWASTEEAARAVEEPVQADAAEPASDEGESVVVRDRAGESLTSFTHLTREDIARRPTEDGNITDLLKSNPAVQFSNHGDGSLQMGEIKPSNISIHGSVAYQNNYTLDGISTNSDLDPAEQTSVTTTRLGGSDERASTSTAASSTALPSTTTTFPPPSAASRAASSTLRPAAGRAKTTSACSAA